MPRPSNTGVKGVSLHKASGRYCAYIYEDDARKYLGLFKTVQEAADAIEYRKQYLKLKSERLKCQDVKQTPLQK